MNPRAVASPHERREEERQLVARMVNGDRSAVNELYARLSPVLLALALKILGHLPDAEEVVQDTFLKMWQKANHYDSSKAPVVTWALVIARGLALDRRRQLVRRESVVSLGVVNAEPEIALGIDPDRMESLNQAYAQLSDAERECLELSLFDDLSHPEIAEARGEALGTIKSRLRRTLLKLRALMEGGKR